MEMDNEHVAVVAGESGTGNSYTTLFRQYDPRLGRWLSVDPLLDKFPSVNSYIGMDDNPINYIDPDGDWAWIINGNKKLTKPFTNGEAKKLTRTKVVKVSNNDALKEKGINNELFNITFLNDYKKRAPIIAKYMEENEIKILIAEMGKGGEQIEAYDIIALKIDNDMFSKKAFLLHEIVHKKYGKSEKKAYAAMMAAGYVTKKEFVKNWIYTGELKGKPTEESKAFFEQVGQELSDEEKNTYNTNPGEFYDQMVEIGNKIIKDGDNNDK